MTARTNCILALLAIVVCYTALWSPRLALGEHLAAPQISSLELARWIDQRIEQSWKEQELTSPPTVDDATFMRRAYLDLVGTIPSVSQTRDFLDETGSFKREDLIDSLLSDDRLPERYESRSAEHWARIWRRVMIPQNSPGAGMASQFEPWLEKQFANNVSYDTLARELITARLAENPQPGQLLATATSGSPEVYYRAIGGTPVNMANAFTRVFLGVRVGCAQCHDHPFSEWKQKDFWGMAAFFSNPTQQGELPKIKDEAGTSYTASVLWDGELDITEDSSPKEALADWMVSPENPNFSATAVNRIWQHLCGRGLVAEVNDLDQVSQEERAVLDELGKLFADAGFDMKWLIEGICKSKFYQRVSMQVANSAETKVAALRPLKTLTPEQVFDSLEQALSLPIGRIDNPPRYNGQRNAFVARMDESASESPEDFRAGIPQALMVMNGALTANATDLDKSRTLRAIVEAPFLKADAKLEALYLAALTRFPSDKELDFLNKHLDSQPNEEARKKAYAEIFWGILNSPEFVLSR